MRLNIRNTAQYFHSQRLITSQIALYNRRLPRAYMRASGGTRPDPAAGSIHHDGCRLYGSGKGKKPNNRGIDIAEIHTARRLTDMEAETGSRRSVL